jgi:hypothetical protein
VLRDDLAISVKANVKAFLISGIAGSVPGVSDASSHAGSVRP